MGSLRAGHRIRTGPATQLASQFTVLNTDRLWAALRVRHDGLTRLGASQVVAYQAVHNHRDVVRPVAASATASVSRLLANPAVMQWFDAAGVIDIPPVFAGTHRGTVHFGDEQPADLSAGLHRHQTRRC
ncbi:hypothetical protein ASE48_16365 [Mycobacterium sp. Root265]|nr:hypothetical protein ASE48_16365 [Mycobacterium sp. Root265]